MSLDDVARITKIQPRILERLEAGKLDGLPADVFVRGFVRSFARCVGLDETEALRRYAACALGSQDLTPTVRALADAMAELAPGASAAPAMPRAITASEVAVAIEVIDATAASVSPDAERPASRPPAEPAVAAIGELPAATRDTAAAAVEFASAPCEAVPGDALPAWPVAAALSEAPPAWPMAAPLTEAMAETALPFESVGSLEISPAAPSLPSAAASLPSAAPSLPSAAAASGAPSLPCAAAASAAPSLLPAAVADSAERPPAAAHEQRGSGEQLTPAAGVQVASAESAEAPASAAPRPRAATVRPATVRPSGVRPATVRPGTVRPGTVRPGTASDESSEPAARWSTRMPSMAGAAVPWRRPACLATALPVAPSLVIDDADPESAERVLEERAEHLTPRRSFLPPILLDREDRSARQGGLTLAVILLLIAATLTLSYLMRRPGASGDGMTLRETPARVG